MSCLACFSGNKDVGTPTGTVKEINSVTCYVKEPDQIQDVVIICPDIFGYTTVNVQLIADSFAKLGYLAIVVDIFNKTEVPQHVFDTSRDLIGKNPEAGIFAKVYGFGTILWHFPLFLIRNPAIKGIQIAEKVIDAIKVDYPGKRIFLHGYCWGGRVVLRLAHRKGYVHGVCTNHPGGVSFPSDITNIETPTLFILPEKDWEIKEEKQKEIQSLITQKPFKTLAKVYPNMEHGFAVRGDEKDEQVLKARQDAFESTHLFFKDCPYEL